MHLIDCFIPRLGSFKLPTSAHLFILTVFVFYCLDYLFTSHCVDHNEITELAKTFFLFQWSLFCSSFTRIYQSRVHLFLNLGQIFNFIVLTFLKIIVLTVSKEANTVYNFFVKKIQFPKHFHLSL